MVGFTTTLTGSTVDQALPRTFGPPPDRTRGASNLKLAPLALQAAPRMRLLPPCIVIAMLEVQAVAETAEWRLRSACARVANNRAPGRAI